jgi:hypothetical protein
LLQQPVPSATAAKLSLEIPDADVLRVTSRSLKGGCTVKNRSQLGEDSWRWRQADYQSAAVINLPHTSNAF